LSRGGARPHGRPATARTLRIAATVAVDLRQARRGAALPTDSRGTELRVLADLIAGSGRGFCAVRIERSVPAVIVSRLTGDAEFHCSKRTHCFPSNWTICISLIGR